jgi:hypothetical protein
MRSKFAAVFAVAAMAGATGGATGAQAQDWSGSATQDLQAIHDALRDNTPQPYIDRPDTASFRSWLEAGLAQAKQQPLSKVDNQSAYVYALRYYTGGFRDANIAPAPNFAPPALNFAVTWPGFSTAWRGGSYVVAFADPAGRNLPPVGAKLVSCDKVPAEQIAKQRLDRYEGDLTVESGRFTSAPYLLWDRANSMLPILPQRCDFDVGGHKRTINITPQFGSTDAVRESAFQAAAPKPSGLGVTSFGSGGFWINLHSLNDQQNWTAFLSQVDQNAAAIRAAPVVVIDLRGMDGGPIRNGYRVINRLWDPDYILANNPPATNLSYRASKANHDFYKALADRLNSDPMTAMDAPRWQSLADALATAMSQNQPLYTRNENAASAAEQPAALAPAIPTDVNGNPLPPTAAAPGAAPAAAPPPPAPTPAAPPPNPMHARVYVLTDYWCSGSCLNLMDVLTRLPGVQQIGTATSADSIFIGQTTVQLPSGHSRIAYGDKAWLDRPRQSNVPYTPAAGLTFTGDLSDDAAVKAWVATVAH